MVIRLKGNANPAGNTAGSIVDRQQLMWLLVLSVAYILRDIVKLPMPDIIFTGLCGAAFVFLSTGSAMGVYVFTSVLTVPDFEIRIVYLAILLAKFFLQRRKVKVSMLLVLVGMAVLELLNMTLFSEQTFAKILYNVGFQLTYYALPLFWFSEDYSKEDYQRALLCYVAGIILGGAVMLWISVESLGWDILLTDPSIRLGMNSTGDYQNQSQMQTDYNANQLGGMFAIAIAIVLAFTDQKKLGKWWAILLVPAALFMVILTKSREAILLVLGISITYFLILAFRKRKLLSATVFLVAVVALLYVIEALFPEAVEGLLARFQDEDNLTGSRAELFVIYMNAWIENIWVFLFGYGIGAYQHVVHAMNVPHNILADILISWGLTGLVLILCILVPLWRTSAKGLHKVNRLVAFLPAIVSFVSVLAGQYLTTGFPHMRLCFLLLAAKAFLDDRQQ